MKKRLFAGLLALCLTVNLMSATAFAEEVTTDNTKVVCLEECTTEVHAEGCPVAMAEVAALEEAKKAAEETAVAKAEEAKAAVTTALAQKAIAEDEVTTAEEAASAADLAEEAADLAEAAVTEAEEAATIAETETADLAVEEAKAAVEEAKVAAAAARTAADAKAQAEADAEKKTDTDNNKQPEESDGIMATSLEDGTEDNVVDTEEALRTAVEAGGLVILGGDISVDADSTMAISAGKQVTIDLGGYTLNGVSDEANANREMFLVKGELTVKNGTITMMHSGTNMGWNSMAAIFDVTAGGVLNIIEGATVENLGGTDMNFGVHLNNWGEVTLNVTKSTIKAPYCAIRIFNSGYDNNNVTITNSTIHADNRAIWVHNYIGDLDSSKHPHEDIKSRLNFDIFNGSNTITAGTDGLKDIVARYGFSYTIYFNASGEQIIDASTLKAKLEAGESVTLNADVDMADMIITIPSGKNVTLDLNGYTITGTDTITGSYGLININPGAELTLKDSSTEKTGKISLTSTNNRGWGAYSSVISNQRGKLIVEGGTIEHLGGTDMAYGIDNLTNGKNTYAETIINGGTIKSTYRAIRQFLNGTEAQNILTVNGGTIEGTNKSIWMQDPNANANSGTLTVGANAKLKGDVYLFVTAGSTEWPVEVSITAGALAEGSNVVTGNVPAGYELIESNGTYSVAKGVAKISNRVFETFTEAINNATENATITLIKDIIIEEGIEISADKKVILDLNGKTITGEPTEAKEYAVITNKGTLTLTGNGKVVCDHKLAGSTGYAVNTITNLGTLTIDGVTIENKSTSSNQIGYAIDNNSTSGNVIVTIEGGTITASGSNYYDGIRQFCNSETLTNSVEVTGGEVSSLWVQNPSDGSGSENTKDMKGSVSILGGTVNALYLEPSKNFTASVNGGNIKTVGYFQTAEGRDVTGFVTAGKFGMDLTDSKVVAATSHVVKTTDGSEVHAIKAVAEVSATCTSSGIKAHYKCDTCGKTYSDAAGKSVLTDVTASAKGHKYSSKSDSSGHWSECSRCGATTDREGHSYTAGKCSCGYETKVEVYVPETTTPATPAPAPTTPATQPTTTTQTTTTTPSTEETTTEQPVETPVEEIVVDTKIVEEVATEEVKAVVKETVTVAEVKEVEKTTETGTVTVTEVKVAVTTETVDKVIENTEAGATVILPLTEATEEGQAVTEAEVAVEALEKVVEAEAALTVEFEGVKVTFEPETIKAIAEQAQGSVIELRVVPVEHHELNEEQQAVLEEHDVAVRVSAQIFSDGEYIGDFKGGKARIAIPFTPEEGKAVEHHKVYFVDDNGEMTLMPSTYVDGHMVLETTHFSDYVIVYEEVADAEETETVVEDADAEEAVVEEAQEEAGLPILPIIIIVIAIIAVAAVFLVRKKNGEE